MKHKGIMDEQSDMRVHVCPKTGELYVFATEAGRKCVRQYIQDGRDAVEAKQPGVSETTAVGYLVRPSEIEGMILLYPRKVAWARYDFVSGDLSQKGTEAERMIAEMCSEGLIPLGRKGGTQVRVVKKGTDENISGSDIVASPGGVVKIQVKLDSRGGAVQRGGSGRLYLQTDERNPLGLI